MLINYAAPKTKWLQYNKEILTANISYGVCIGMHCYVHILQVPTSFLNQMHTGWFLEITFMQMYIIMLCACTCVHPHARS